MCAGRGSGQYRRPLAFRRSTAALAAPDVSSIGSAPDPRFLRPGRAGRYPVRACHSLPSTSGTGHSAGRSGTQSRPGAVCETARGLPRSLRSSDRIRKAPFGERAASPSTDRSGRVKHCRHMGDMLLISRRFPASCFRQTEGDRCKFVRINESLQCVIRPRKSQRYLRVDHTRFAPRPTTRSTIYDARNTQRLALRAPSRTTSGVV
jgi:hypothetical protein